MIDEIVPARELKDHVALVLGYLQPRATRRVVAS